MRLGVIWGELQISVEHRLAAWFVTSTVRFYGHENSVDLFKHIRIIEFQNPAFLRRVILIENSKIDSLTSVGTAPAPGLKCARASGARLLVQVVGVKDERLALGIKHSSCRLSSRAVPCYVVDFGHIEVPRAH